MNGWTGFLVKWSLLCLPAWAPLKAELEAKVVCLGSTGSLHGNVVPGAAVREKQQR